MLFTVKTRHSGWRRGRRRAPGLAPLSSGWGESVTDRRPTGRVLQDILGLGYRPPTRVRRHGSGARADPRAAMAEWSPRSSRRSTSRRPTGQGGDVLVFADQRVRQRLVGGNSTFDLVIVVAVDRVPGQPPAGGSEWSLEPCQGRRAHGATPQRALARLGQPCGCVAMVAPPIRDPLSRATSPEFGTIDPPSSRSM